MFGCCFGPKAALGLSFSTVTASARIEKLPKTYLQSSWIFHRYSPTNPMKHPLADLALSAIIRYAEVAISPETFLNSVAYRSAMSESRAMTHYYHLRMRIQAGPLLFRHGQMSGRLCRGLQQRNAKMQKQFWGDLFLCILAGEMLWQPFRITGLLDGTLPAVIVVAIGCLMTLPILRSFNRKYPQAAAKRVSAKIAVLFCVLSLAVAMWMVITGGLAVA